MMKLVRYLRRLTHCHARAWLVPIPREGNRVTYIYRSHRLSGTGVSGTLSLKLILLRPRLADRGMTSCEARGPGQVTFGRHAEMSGTSGILLPRAHEGEVNSSLLQPTLRIHEEPTPYVFPAAN